MLYPKKTKFRKVFKGKIRGISSRGNHLSFGDYGLKVLEKKRIKSNQIESARKAISGSLKRSGKLWIRIFPHTPVVKKPVEVRMGKGKGDVDHFVSKVKPGKILFELNGVSKEDAYKAFIKASAKLSTKTRIVTIYE